MRISVFPLLILLYGCLNEPDSAGIETLPPSDYPQIKVDTVYCNSDSLAYTFINSTFDSRMFLGNAGNYVAWSFVEFGFTPFELYKSLPILSVKLRLKTNYSFGGGAAPLSVQLFPATQNWHSDSLMFDSLQANATAYYDPAKQIGGASSSPADTDWYEIAISDTQLVRQSITQESAGLSYGILIKPVSTTDIKGFESGNISSDGNRPALTMTFDSLGTPVNVEITANQSRSLVHIPQANLVTDNRLLFVQNGVSYREYLGFDLSKIPISSSISKAELELTLDSAASLRNAYGKDSVISAYVANDNSLVSSSQKITTSTSDGGEKVYRLALVTYVQNWIRPAATQHRLALYGFAERTTLDRFAFYGGTWANPALRPRLIVTYTPPPQKATVKK